MAAIAEQVKAQIGPLRPKVVEEVRRVIAEVLKEKAAVAKELLEKMDLDHDGRVVRSEFEESFIEITEQVIGCEKMIEKVNMATLQQ